MKNCNWKGLGFFFIIWKENVKTLNKKISFFPKNSVPFFFVKKKKKSYILSPVLLSVRNNFRKVKVETWKSFHFWIYEEKMLLR